MRSELLEQHIHLIYGNFITQAQIDTDTDRVGTVAEQNSKS